MLILEQKENGRSDNMAKVLDSETLDILYNDLVRLVDKKIKNIKDK